MIVRLIQCSAVVWAVVGYLVMLRGIQNNKPLATLGGFFALVVCLAVLITALRAAMGW